MLSALVLFADLAIANDAPAWTRQCAAALDKARSDESRTLPALADARVRVFELQTNAEPKHWQVKLFTKTPSFDVYMQTHQQMTELTITVDEERPTSNIEPKHLGEWLIDTVGRHGEIQGRIRYDHGRAARIGWPSARAYVDFEPRLAVWKAVTEACLKTVAFQHG